MPDIVKRKAGWSILFSLWATAQLILSDAAYGGYFLKLQNYAWAAPYYHFLASHIGFSFTNLGFFALHFAFVLALAGGILGIASLRRGSLLYKLFGMISLLAAGAVIWYAGPGLLLTAAGMLLLIVSPHTQSLWDRLFAVIVLLLPLTALLLCRLPAHTSRLPAETVNDL